MTHENWTEKDERRMDVVAQNGNDGTHYDAIGRDDDTFQRDLKLAGLDLDQLTP